MKKKKLYLISQNKNTGHDIYDSAIVCAESQEDAVKIHPSDGKFETDKDGNFIYCRYVGDWVKNISDVQCELIAENSYCDYGVVLSSFNAG